MVKSSIVNILSFPAFEEMVVYEKLATGFHGSEMSSATCASRGRSSQAPVDHRPVLLATVVGLDKGVGSNWRTYTYM